MTPKPERAAGPPPVSPVPIGAACTRAGIAAIATTMMMRVWDESGAARFAAHDQVPA
jgi:hypothetical protein